FGGGVHDLDATGTLGADQSDTRGEGLPQRIFQSGQLRGAAPGATGGVALLALDAGLGRAHRPRVGEDLRAKLELFGRGGKREKRARVAHGQAARQRRSPTTIWNCWPWRLTITGWRTPERFRDCARSRKLLSSKAFLGCLGLATMLSMGNSWTLDAADSAAGEGAGDGDRRAPS